MNASDQITDYIKSLADWRGALLARLRTLILAADPSMLEEWKWGTPVWSHNGNVLAAGAFQAHVKLNFFKGASLDEIGEVLRHKSRETTAIYAKVDLESLRALALPWPGGGR